MISYRNALSPLIFAMWMEVSSQDAPKTGFIPQFLCDYERPQMDHQVSCIISILPSEITNILNEKMEKVLKGKDMYDFLQELCQKAPKLILHGKRGLLQAVPKPNRPLLSVTIDVCVNSTLFTMPLIPKTRYEDLE